MVKIAIAGGSGNVALEVIDALVATKEHKILLLSRKSPPTEEHRQGVTWAQTDYLDPQTLAETLSSVHTVLSFVVVQSDPENISQRNLITACIKAGVKRFAPSEWAASNFEHLPFYSGKAQIRDLLAELNRDKKVLEYCLFLPGLFTNYFTYPHRSATHFRPFETQIDFQNRRALTIANHDSDRLTLTTAQDFAAVVVRAIAYQGEWPVIGGIKGTELTIGELLSIGEKARGQQFQVDRLDAEDLKQGIAKASWLPIVDHPGIPREHAVTMAGQMVASMLLATSAGALNVGDEWNRLLPDYEFTQAEEFLVEAWRGKP